MQLSMTIRKIICFIAGTFALSACIENGKAGGHVKNIVTTSSVEPYQPAQSIDFSHKIHAGVHEIDCRYCHTLVSKSKAAGMPSVNVCMNCHKQTEGLDSAQLAKVKTIHSAAGWDGTLYTGETHPILWKRTHRVPDELNFNHSKHVVEGGMDCRQCHGDMKTENGPSRIVPVSELNKIAGNVNLAKPTLTKGWCMECHQKKGISGVMD